METLIGFVVGYVVGSRQGRDGLRRAWQSVDAIRSSPEVHEVVKAGRSIAATTARRVLSGNAGSMLAEAVDALAHKANEAFGTTSPHVHAA